MKSILWLMLCSVFLVANDAVIEDNMSEVPAQTQEALQEANLDDIGLNMVEIKKHPVTVKNHPYIVHLSVAFCVAVFLVSILNMLIYKKLTFVDYVLLLATVGLFFLSFITGESSYGTVQSYVGSETVRDSLMLHKRLGFLLLGGVGVLFVLRNILFVLKGRVAHIVYLGLFAAFLLAALMQGYTGIELVFTHGIGVYYDGLLAN